MSDPNYNEVVTEVDMIVDQPIPKSVPLVRQIINYILLVLKRIWYRIIGKKEVVYKPEVVGLKFVHINDLTEGKLEELGRKPKIYVEDEHIMPELGVYHSKGDALNNMFDDKKFLSVPSTYIVRNRISGRVVIAKGTLEMLRKTYNNDYEIVEPTIKE